MWKYSKRNIVSEMYMHSILYIRQIFYSSTLNALHFIFQSSTCGITRFAFHKLCILNCIYTYIYIYIHIYISGCAIFSRVLHLRYFSNFVVILENDARWSGQKLRLGRVQKLRFGNGHLQFESWLKVCSAGSECIGLVNVADIWYCNYITVWVVVLVLCDVGFVSCS